MSGGAGSNEMQVFRSLAEIPAGFGPTVAVVGNFDGVHRGHREILAGVTTEARAIGARGAGAKAVAVTFDPHPEQFLRPDKAPRLITPTAERLRLLAETGIDAALLLKFDEELACLAPREFVERILVVALGVRSVHEGQNFRFGHGAAAGIAGAYNAPITGAIFAAHIVLGNFSMNLFAPLLCSSVVSAVLSRSFFGIHRWYEVPNFDFTSIVQLPWFLILGFFAGVLGAMFLRLLKLGKEFFQRVPALYTRMAVGGLLVGAIALAFPEVWGNGYDVTNQIIQQPPKFDILLGIFAAKLAATVVTVGSGAVGGVITPTLFLGAGLGSLLGIALQQGGLAPGLPIGIFALAGMGSVFAATTRSPLLAIVMVLEISLNYSIMPALMLGCAVSTLVSRRLHPDSVYTEPLKLRSLEVEASRLGAATEQTIGDLMRAPVAPVRENTTLPDIAGRFLSSANNFLPVVDARERLLGVVALQDLKEYLTGGSELAAVIAGDVMRPIPPCLRPGQKLLDALPVLLASEQRNVPVVNNFEEKRLVGSILRAEALAALSEAIAAGASTTASTEVIAKERQSHPPVRPAPK